MTLEQAYKECSRIQKKHGKSYFFATLFFQKKQRKAVNALYAFFRLPDEMVDTETPEKADVLLEQWEADWMACMNGAETTHPVLMATRDVFFKYDIPMQYASDFLAAMRQDLTKTRYEDYPSLQGYMYGSAVVVGLMMVYIIGWIKDTTFDQVQQPAAALGEAMQLTNFIRDIGEDFRLRGRIYMPLDELRTFHLTEKDIEQASMSQNMVEFLQWQIARADELYEEANKGIALLNKEGRLPVRLASDLYRFILRKIEQNQYDVFTKRAKTSLTEKIKTIPLSMLYV
ncbi:MAG: phytoene/squalene synthase family protein [Candidatus Magasanikbacteria bacterium]|nr:phytoene/squalene synthase family protein [Candidatus Magasanikbacteria bacterium]MCA9391388.1 phytoene/squalene synthase family protein [Candidatus Magasanikbacteria bacterium]USN52832.1 MAG: phytoene/squalene synthase family protein [Candidatus Nomurabacteria bacterium]HPF95345.1 phytoene/squalene synthase family protein [bacterium]